MVVLHSMRLNWYVKWSVWCDTMYTIQLNCPYQDRQCPIGKYDYCRHMFQGHSTIFSIHTHLNKPYSVRNDEAIKPFCRSFVPFDVAAAAFAFDTSSGWYAKINLSKWSICRICNKLSIASCNRLGFGWLRNTLAPIFMSLRSNSFTLADKSSLFREIMPALASITGSDTVKFRQSNNWNMKKKHYNCKKENFQLVICSV